MIIDTNTNCTDNVPFMVSRGIEAVGRYYTTRHPGYAIQKPEARKLSDAGIKIFTVFEDYGQASAFTLTESQGRHDGDAALAQAEALGQPHGTVIYFAVEGLPNGYRSADIPHVIDYFQGVQSALANRYLPGVYGDGIVCSKLLDAGLCSHSWLAQASWSFEGSQSFYKSKRWNLAQIVTDLPTNLWHGLSVDINEGQQDIGAFFI